MQISVFLLETCTLVFVLRLGLDILRVLCFFLA